LDLVIAVDTAVAISPARWANRCGFFCRTIPIGARWIAKIRVVSDDETFQANIARRLDQHNPRVMHIAENVA